MIEIVPFPLLTIPLEIAKASLAQNIDVPTIALITGLSEDEIEGLK